MAMKASSGKLTQFMQFYPCSVMAYVKSVTFILPKSKDNFY